MAELWEPFDLEFHGTQRVLVAGTRPRLTPGGSWEVCQFPASPASLPIIEVTSTQIHRVPWDKSGIMTMLLSQSSQLASEKRMADALSVAGRGTGPGKLNELTVPGNGESNLF